MRRTTQISAVLVTTVGIAAVAGGVLHSCHPDYSAARSFDATGIRPALTFGARREGEGAIGRESAGVGRTVTVEKGLLTVKLTHQVLGPVLAEIADKGHLSIVSVPSVDARATSIELRGVPIELGLRELLKDYDVFFYDSAGTLRSVWVYEKDAGAAIVPAAPDNWASTADVVRQLSSGSPAERISAIETLVARNAPGSTDLVNRALLDDNAEVRERALDVGLSAGVSISRETLASLTYDSSAPVRILALEAIVAGTPLDGPDEAATEQLIRHMMTDPDTDVRAKASELLDNRHPSN